MYKQWLVRTSLLLLDKERALRHARTNFMGHFIKEIVNLLVMHCYNKAKHLEIKKECKKHVTTSLEVRKSQSVY